MPDTYIYMASAVLIRKRVGWSEGGVVNYEGTRVELQGEAKRPPSGLFKDKTTDRGRSRRCCRERPIYRFQACKQDRTI